MIALARTLLKSVLRIDPYNTEVWQALNALRDPGTDPVLHKAEMIRLLAFLIPSSGDAVPEHKERSVDGPLENENGAPPPITPSAASSDYVRVMAKMWFVPDLVTWEKAE